jgi:hypothetical protein
MLHLPLMPRTARVIVSPDASGVLRVPTVDGAGRVSISLHGEMGTSERGASAACADQSAPLPPTETATAAPMAAQRDRTRRDRRVDV